MLPVVEAVGKRDVDPAARAGYDALRSGAIVLDRGDRARWRFTGPNAAETLTGLVTNDVLALQPGDGLYAAALTPKGKIVADLRIFCDSDGLLVDTNPAAAAGWRSMTRKFINPRVAPLTEISHHTSDVGLFGTRAAELLSEAVEPGGCAFDQLRPYAHVRARTSSSAHEVMVIRAAELGDIPGFDIVGPGDVIGELRAGLESLGAVTAPREVFDIARIEAGFPEWGVDMTEDTLPQEANLDELGAISYSKGCYVGQEVVARIHFRGHVNKMLRRVTFDGTRVLPRGAELLDSGGKVVGDLRSSAASPRFGGVGVAMVRREVAQGATLVANADERRTEVIVT